MRFTLEPAVARTGRAEGTGKVVVIHDSFWEAVEPAFAGAGARQAIGAHPIGR